MTSKIVRDVNAAADTDFDLIIVGGGIHGVCMLFEATRQGQRALLLEMDDFGGATSWSSHRIIHGGLRYLQSLNLRRAVDSIREQAWFLAAFPDLVHPLECLMPLSGNGLRRPVFFRAGLAAYAGLRRVALHSQRSSESLPPGRVISAEETSAMACGMELGTPRGGGIWHDAMMVAPQRVVMRLLRYAARGGATALNRVRVTGLMTDGHQVSGVDAIDHETGSTHRFRARVVINCAGPWSRDIAETLDRDVPALGSSSLAFSLLVDRTHPFDVAYAATGPNRGDRTYFLVPFRGMLSIGTEHVPWRNEVDDPRPTEGQVLEMLTSVNAAVPGLSLQSEDVLRVFSGVMPADSGGAVEPRERTTLIDHGVEGGPNGFFTAQGVKYTTARLLAEQTLRTVFDRFPSMATTPEPTSVPDLPIESVGEALDLCSPQEFSSCSDDMGRALVGRFVNEESVIHVDDIIFRRTDWGLDPRDVMPVANRIFELIDWPQARIDEERNRLGRILAKGGVAPL